MDNKAGQAPGPSGSQSPVEDIEEPYIIPASVSDLKGCHPKSGIKDVIATNPMKKLKLCPVLNPNLLNENFKVELKETFKTGGAFLSENVEIIIDPFQVFVIDNFLENTDFADGILQDFNEVEWLTRRLDMFELFQTEDVKYLNQGYIKGFYELLKNSVMPWVAEVTDFELVDISCTCACYTNTDFLLVHDDQREDRKIAFIYYINSCKEWDASKGGSLDLLSRDEKGLPVKVVRSILPKTNQLVFFPVSTSSYHQVAEVTSLEDTRFSISGWFHVRDPPEVTIPEFEFHENSLFGKNLLKPVEKDILLESWIEESYLNKEDRTLEDIQKQMEEESEISLKEFFREEALNEVISCLEIVEDNGKWIRTAPPNRSLYDVLCTDESTPHSLRRFLDFFQSRVFFDYLKIITDIDFTSMKFELQRWTPGSFCCLNEYDWNKEELDVIVYFPCGENKDIIGGRIEYVNAQSKVKEAAVTVEPSYNTLNLVYRDIARFSSYFSKQSRCKKFYILICSYSE